MCVGKQGVPLELGLISYSSKLHKKDLWHSHANFDDSYYQKKVFAA